MIVDCAVYEDGQRVGGDLPLELAMEAGLKTENGFVWIGLHEPTAAEFESVRQEFDLHPLAVEDAIHAHQRPKLEVYGSSTFAVLKTATYVDPDEVVDLGDIMLFIGDRFVVSVRHGHHRALTSVRKALEADPDRLRRGPSAVLHAVVDVVVDDYHGVLAGLEHDIDEIEEQVFASRGLNHGERIFKLKREVLDFRRAVRPLADALADLAAGTVPGVDPDLGHWFRDVHDHVLRVADAVDGLDSILGSALAANLAQVGVRQNEDMRKISSWVAIAAVPTMVAGIYGMNFDHMPELRWTYSYPVVLVLLAVACVILYRQFKRRDWL